LDAITGFSYFPLQVAIYASLVLGLIAVLAVPIVAFLRLSTGELVFEGQATTLVVTLLLSSFQFFFFFILGQYIARIYDEVRQRPHYVVAEVWEKPDEPGTPASVGAPPPAETAISPVPDSPMPTERREETLS